MYRHEISDEDSLRAYIQDNRFGIPSARWIGVPTTSGTGSEVTCWATIWDPSKGIKRSVENHANYAYAALVDPCLTEGMPLKLAVSSALDAVAHAVEAYWARGTNAVSRALALQAIRTGHQYGGVAQPVEHLLHTQGVTDSSSVVSTKNNHTVWCGYFFAPQGHDTFSMRRGAFRPSGRIRQSRREWIPSA